MAATEHVTVRMSRSDSGTPWGFRLQGGQEFASQMTIGKVAEGSLADRAGLRDGDRVLQIAGAQTATLRHQAAQDTISHSGNNLDLVVERPATKIWQPSVIPIDLPQGDITSSPVKYSLAHDQSSQNYSTVGSGHNVQSRPFGQPQQQEQRQYSSSSTRTTTMSNNQNQYNSPASLHSRPSAAEQYLQQTGGLFGTDPKLNQKIEPTYLKSETLRLIKESESRTGGGQQQTQGSAEEFSRPPTLPNTPSPYQFQSKFFIRLTRALAEQDDENGEEQTNTTDAAPVAHVEPPRPAQPSPTSATGGSGAPLCDHCGRLIHGVFCKAGGKTLHGECFKCATCGGTLKNIGYFLVNGKLYCDIHARQQQQDQFKANPPIDPNLFHTYPRPQGVRKPVEPVKAFYQPEILKPGPVSVNLPHAAPISPQSRGIPTHQAGNETGSDYSSNYQYRKTTKKTTTTTTNSQQQQQQQQQQFDQQPYSITVTPGSQAPLLSAGNEHYVPIQRQASPAAPFSSGPPPTSAPFSNMQSEHYTIIDTPLALTEEGASSEISAPVDAVFSPTPAPSAHPAIPLEQRMPKLTKRMCWPPPKAMKEQRDKVVPYWRIPAGLSEVFGPGASGNDDYKKLISYHASYPSSRKAPPKPKRSFLLEDVHLQEEWRREQARLAPERAAAAAMLQTMHFRPAPYSADGRIQVRPARTVELWQSVDDTRKLIDHLQSESMADTSEHSDSTLDPGTSACFAYVVRRAGEPDGKPAYVNRATVASNTSATLEHPVQSDDQFIRGHSYHVGQQSPHTLTRQVDSSDTELAEAALWSAMNSLKNELNQTLLVSSSSKEYVLSESLPMNEHKRNVTCDNGPSSQQELKRKSVRAISDVLMECGADFGDASSDTKWTSGGPGGHVGGGSRPGSIGARRGRGILKQLHEAPRIPICETCNREIRGPFVLALNKTWCPDHFVCATPQCKRKLLDIGFVEENGLTYCEHCYEKYFAPTCSKCSRPVVGDCLTALERQWHPDCFVCTQCRKPFGNSSFFLENGQPYCETDWNQLFTTKCVACQFSIDAGDRWVEALGSAYHSECFCCSVCQKNLEGQSFYAKGGRPYCKAHA